MIGSTFEIIKTNLNCSFLMCMCTNTIKEYILRPYKLDILPESAELDELVLESTMNWGDLKQQGDLKRFLSTSKE